MNEAVRAEHRVAMQFETIEQQRRADLAGLWVFLGTEVLFFGGAFAAFAVYRSQYPQTFAEAAKDLNLLLGSINTAIILTSGCIMAFADLAVAARRRGLLMLQLASTICLGIAFMTIKGTEYVEEIHKHVAPFAGLPFEFTRGDPGQARLFYSFYFTLTAMHALHMAIGIGLIAILLVIVWRWREPPKIERQVMIIALYWGFVDVVWMFVYSSLYLLRS